jgi:predicted glycosyltransferase
MTKPRIFFYVQYLQGVGHLYRALHIAQAMTRAGLVVDLVSGGMPVPGLDTGHVNFHQLSPIKCRDGDFSDLIDVDGDALDNSLKDQRRDELLSLYRASKPDAILVEAFPFGRRQMRFELLPLLERAQSSSPKPVIISSIRDILQVSSKPGRADESVDYINQFFDNVLVHGDPSFAMLEETFPGAKQFSDKIHYTGLVSGLVRQSSATQDKTDGEVLVSAGGGGTQSERLLAAAMEARSISKAKHRHWRLLAGPNLPDTELVKLNFHLPDGITLESNRSDFTSLLANCAVSVSQAGYNTVVDLMRCGCRSVVVPYSARGETEQLFRARRLQERGVAHLVEDSELSPQTLASAIDAVLIAPTPGASTFNLEGAERSASLVSGWL